MNEIRVRKVSAMEKVFPHKTPSGEGMEDVIIGLKGENLSFQLAFLWEGKEKGNMFAEIHSSIARFVKIRCVRLVPCEYPAHADADEDYLCREPGLYPDLLTEPDVWGIDLIPGYWRSLWIDVMCDSSIEAGNYPVQFDLVKNGEIIASVTEMVEILDAELPSLPIPHTEWLHTDCLAEYYGVEVFSEDYWEITENFIRTAVKRKCNMILTPVFTPPLDTEIGGERCTVQLVDVWVMKDGYRFGYEKLVRWVEMCRRCGVRYFEISHLFTQWGAKMAPKIMGIKDGREVRLFGWETDAAGREYQEFLHQFLQSLDRELKYLGIEKQTYFHISDEPDFSQMESYRKAKKAVEEDLKGYQIIDAVSDYRFFEESLIQQPVCAIDHMEAFLEKRPEKLWGYYCTAQGVDVSNRFIAQPGYRTRILGAQIYKYALDGFLHWGYNFYHSEYSRFSIDPYRSTDAGAAFPSGDPFLVYPGKDGKPEESIRMMLMDGAMSDLCAMICLERFAGRDEVMSCIEPEGEEVSWKVYPRSILYLNEMRKRIYQSIRKHIQSGKNTAGSRDN